MIAGANMEASFSHSAHPKSCYETLKSVKYVPTIHGWFVNVGTVEFLKHIQLVLVGTAELYFSDTQLYKTCF